MLSAAKADRARGHARQAVPDPVITRRRQRSRLRPPDSSDERHERGEACWQKQAAITVSPRPRVTQIQPRQTTEARFRALDDPRASYVAPAAFQERPDD